MFAIRRSWATYVVPVLMFGIGQAHAQDPIDRKIQTLTERYESEMRTMRAEYEARIGALEDRLGGLRSELDGALSDRVESELATSVDALTQEVEHDHRHHGRFDNTHNPAISVIGDFVLAVSSKNDAFDLHDRFLLRGVEVGFSGHAAAEYFEQRPYVSVA